MGFLKVGTNHGDDQSGNSRQPQRTDGQEPGPHGDRVQAGGQGVHHQVTGLDDGVDAKHYVVGVVKDLGPEFVLVSQDLKLLFNVGPFLLVSKYPVARHVSNQVNVPVYRLAHIFIV